MFWVLKVVVPPGPWGAKGLDVQAPGGCEGPQKPLFLSSFHSLSWGPITHETSSSQQGNKFTYFQMRAPISQQGWSHPWSLSERSNALPHSALPMSPGYQAPMLPSAQKDLKELEIIFQASEHRGSRKDGEPGTTDSSRLLVTSRLCNPIYIEVS